MRRTVLLLLLLCVAAITDAQNLPPSLNLGDPAPPLRVHQWLKGTPVKQFKKGHVYVLEFWATWCKPCIAAMPHLSTLAREYNDKVTFIGMDIYEDDLKPRKSIKQIKAFVDSVGRKMDYSVATEDSNFTVADWLEASDEKRNGIPNTFVVNAEGRLAWIGYPTELDEVLRMIVNNTWDVNKALVERNEYRRLEKLEDSLREQLNGYVGDPSKQYDLGKPDSALLLIDEIVKKESKLKYAPAIAFHTFSFLLKTDLNKAYEYGKQMMVAPPSYRGTDYDAIIYPIEWSEKTNLITLSAKFYELGAEAYQAKINQYPSSTNLPQNYLKIADWYWRGKNNAKATEAAQKAIEAMENEKTF
jgi:thiol-disulfide isomerase/thioredoxin